MRALGQVTSSGVEPFVGAGVFGVVAWLAVHIIRRTHQIDERNDTVSKAYMEIAFQREATMSARLDAALAQVEHLHTEIARMRTEHELERHRWEQERGP